MVKIRRIKISTKLHLNKTFRWDIKNSTALPVIMMFPLIMFICMSLADIGLSILSYITFAALMSGFAFMLVIFVRNRELSKYGMLSFIFMLSLIVLSLINTGSSDVKNAIYMASEIFMFQMLCYYYRKRIHVIVIAANIFLSLCVYTNFIHMLLHPNLWILEEEKTNLGYLLGYNYNGMGFRFILAITFSILCVRYSKIWLLNAIPVIILSIVPLIMTGSKTSLAGIILFLLVCCIPSIKLQKMTIYGVLLFIILFQIFIVFSGKGLENNEFAVYLIEDLLEKDITFSFRTYLWDMSLAKISESPIWGFGNLDYVWYASHIHTTVGTGPCNLILGIMLNGGTILLALFVLQFYVSAKRLIHYNERYSIVVMMGLTTIMMMHLMEYLSYVFVFYLMTLAYYYPYIKYEFEPLAESTNTPPVKLA